MPGSPASAKFPAVPPSSPRPSCWFCLATWSRWAGWQPCGRGQLWWGWGAGFSKRVFCQEVPKVEMVCMPGEKEPDFNWAMFWKFLRPQLLAVTAAIVFAFGAAMLNIHIPLLLGQMVNVVAKHMRGVLTFGYILLLSWIGEKVAGSMRKQLFSSFLREEIAFFDANQTGHLVNHLTADIQEFKSSFKLVISQGLRSLTQTMGCFVSHYLISPKLTGLLVVVMPFLVGTGTFLSTSLRRLSRKAQEQVSKATAVADEALGNVRTVRAFAMEPKEVQEYATEVDISSRLNMNLGLGIAFFQGLSNVALNSIIWVCSGKAQSPLLWDALLSVSGNTAFLLPCGKGSCVQFDT